MIRRARVEMALHPVVITSGATASSNGSVHRVEPLDFLIRDVCHENGHLRENPSTSVLY